MTPLTKQDIDALKAVDVMSAEPQEDAETINKAIDLLENSKLILKLPNNIFETLRRLAEFKQQSIEDYAISILHDSLNQKVGSAWISGPSALNGNKLEKKVTGPSFATREMI